MAKSPKRLKKSEHPDSEAQQEVLEHEWKQIGLTGPARKALVEEKLYKVSDLRKVTAAELLAIPGVSKSAIARIKVIMNAKKIRFRD
jgi:DNA-directed RNA polymerase alpha subunit